MKCLDGNMKNIRILFLDIDGVLNSEEYAKWCYTDDGKQYLAEGGDIFVDRNAVNLIKRLCDEHDVRIVISSSWRVISLSATIKSFEEYKDLKCLNKYIVGITPKYHSENLIRGDEINDFYNNIRHFDLCNYDKFMTGSILATRTLLISYIASLMTIPICSGFKNVILLK